MRLASVDDMLSGKESRYALVIGVAKRAREIADELCEKEMAALVYHNYYAEKQNCHGNSPYLAPNPRGSYAE